MKINLIKFLTMLNWYSNLRKLTSAKIWEKLWDSIWINTSWNLGYLMLYHIYFLTLLHEIYSAMWLKLIFCKLTTNLVTIIIIRQDIGQMIMYLTCYRVINVYHTKQSCLTKHVMLISCLCLTYLLPVPWGPSSPSWLYPGVNKGTKSVCLALLEVCYSIFEVRTIKRVDHVWHWVLCCFICGY